MDLLIATGSFSRSGNLIQGQVRVASRTATQQLMLIGPSFIYSVSSHCISTHDPSMSTAKIL